MSELGSESSEDEHSEVREKRTEGRHANRLPVIQLMPRSGGGSPGGSPRISPKDSPRASPRNSPLLFRKLMMNRSICLQRRFTLAHTPRQARGQPPGHGRQSVEEPWSRRGQRATMRVTLCLGCPLIRDGVMLRHRPG
ncbi:unnamed protein product [Arctogadus glacialis]